jgi:transposase-like protein
MQIRAKLGHRPMLNFKSFCSVSSVLAGIELIHMLRKGQFAIDGADAISFADQFLRWQEWSVQFERHGAVPGNSAI